MPGGEVVNDWVVIDGGGVINDVRVGDAEDCKSASVEVEKAFLN